MIKQLWRFRTSLFPGLAIATLLLSFAGSLLWALLVSSNASTPAALNGRIMSLLRFTIYQAALSTIISIAIGIVLAWALNRQPLFRGRSILITLFSSSLVLPSLIVAFGIISVLGNHGWINQLAESITGNSFGGFVYGLGGILTAHVYLNASFASMGLLRAFESIPVEKYRLAKSLGMGPWQKFRYIEWVAIRGSIPSIASTIFLLCFSSFAIVLLLGGSPSYNTLEVAIYEAVRIDFDIPFALRLAYIQLLVSVMLVFATSGLKSGLSNLKQSSMSVPWKDLPPYHYLQIMIITLLSVIYILPLISIVLDGLHSDLWSIVHKPLFIRSLTMSLLIASISAVLTVLFVLLLSESKRDLRSDMRLGNSTFSRIADLFISFSANFYLAIPTMIMGLGFFLLARELGGDMQSWGIVAIIVANLLMSLPFAFSIIAPVMQKTSQRYDKLVLSLGLNWLQQWKYAKWPYLRRSVGYIFALSFALSLGDLGVISLFGNSEITTLPWYLYQLMGSYHNTDANGVAFILFLMVIGIFSVVNLGYRKGNNA